MVLLPTLESKAKKQKEKPKDNASIPLGGASFEDTPVVDSSFLGSANWDLPVIQIPSGKETTLSAPSMISGIHEVMTRFLGFLACALLLLVQRLKGMRLDPSVEKPKQLVATLDQALTGLQQNQQVQCVSAE
ncbi:hypothetical protein R1flu_027441 [Riccia fluitans]|uniref:Uncharacterized protein n=1 Tax=Riccia fluitans TaxID=41844 RepID=A0ABD1XJJ4_9MARC